MIIENYLAPIDFQSRIGGVAANLIGGEIQPYWLQFREDQLDTLLPDDHAFWTWALADEQVENATYTALGEALRRWAVYAIWGEYVLQGDAQQTKSGLTVKRTDESEPLSSSQRTELHRRYVDRAYKQKDKFLALLAPVTACTSVRRRSRRVRIIGRNHRDQF